ncbi:MAG: hypothetical protein SCALA702_19300 [Melioribacteraceae bacterium]|nr:MAG: hypothetical protein SCALA702_19300 [Melioribacteraceae bacterium]
MNDRYRDVQIIALTKEDSQLLLNLLKSLKPEYMRYFHPFHFDHKTVFELLDSKVKDKYFGIKVNGKLGGFYMLRGFDKGYEIPSYGVIIDENYSGCGLAMLTLNHMYTFCRVNKIKKVMLKVHPDNVRAKKIYIKAGFVETGVDEKNGHIVFHKKIELCK